MADTEQSTETKDTPAAEDAAAADETPAAESADAAKAPEAEAAASAEKTPAEETPAEETPAAETPAAEAAEEGGQLPAAEDAPEAEQPAVAEAPEAEEPAAAEAPAAAAAAPAPAAAPGDAPQYTYEELKGKTVAQMRDIAEGLGEHDALQGYTTMHKEELLVALCAALGIEAHEHHEVVGIDKSAVKSKIRELKKQRDALIEAKDSKQLKLVRTRIRRLKRKIHKATV